MTDNELKEYQVLANKALALFMLNPTPANRKIAADAAMAYKEAILISELMSEDEGSTKNN